MKDWQSRAHVKWDCKYHVVILPKYRRKVLYGRMRRGIGQILRDLCRQKDIEFRGLKEGKSPVSCSLYTRRPRSLRRCDPNPR